MQIKEIPARAKIITVEEDSQVVARGRLYLIENNLHTKPCGFIEDVYVKESHRGKGLGKKIILEIIDQAKKENCYKIIGCSRYQREKVHEFYKKLGFIDHGKEFRLNLE